jgi:hypothetical protein
MVLHIYDNDYLPDPNRAMKGKLRRICINVDDQKKTFDGISMDSLKMDQELVMKLLARPCWKGIPRLMDADYYVKACEATYVNGKLTNIYHDVWVNQHIMLFTVFFMAYFSFKMDTKLSGGSSLLQKVSSRP